MRFIAASACALVPVDALACGGRPGTPTDMSAMALSQSEILLKWRDTAKDSEFKGGYGDRYYDIEVTDQNGRGRPQSVTGEYNLFNKTFKNLDFNRTYCFRMRARTEPGTQGCVSLRWSGRVCATTPVPPIAGVRIVRGAGPWAAIAASGDGFLGHQVDARTEAQARAGARSGCGSAAAKCNNIRAGKHPCVSFAESRQGGYWFGSAVAANANAVITKAMDRCAASGAPAGSCKVIETACRQP